MKDIDVSNIDTKDVMLLIGTDSPAAHIPLEVRSGKNDQQYAIRTRLGWAICGPVGNTNASNKISMNFQQSSGDMLSLTKLDRMCTAYSDESTRNKSEAMSTEDNRTLKFMESSVTREDGNTRSSVIRMCTSQIV